VKPAFVIAAILTVLIVLHTISLAFETRERLRDAGFTSSYQSHTARESKPGGYGLAGGLLLDFGEALGWGTLCHVVALAAAGTRSIQRRWRDAGMWLAMIPATGIALLIPRLFVIPF
jgi:hypothetical protein